MANKHHLSLLLEGSTNWNAWRIQNPDVRPDLNSADLAGANLQNINLDGAILDNSILDRAIMTRASLVSSKLAHSSLGNAVLSHANCAKADLSHANLRGATLEHINLSGSCLQNAQLHKADMIDANLSRADLREAVFWNTSLIGANLENADLTKANLCGADCYRTTFRNANLTAVSLETTSLVNSDLRGAILTSAYFWYTVLGNSNLRNATGLTTCHHADRSIIDHDTIKKSQLPSRFLRGCGVSEPLIKFMSLQKKEKKRSLLSCFISYSKKDHSIAKKIHSDLQEAGVRCWFADEDMKAGDRLRIKLDQSIRSHDKLLAILSHQSIESNWVEQEIETALSIERTEKRIVLLPIRLDDSVMKISTGWPAFLRNSRHIADFRDWKKPKAYATAISRLLASLDK